MDFTIFICFVAIISVKIVSAHENDDDAKFLISTNQKGNNNEQGGLTSRILPLLIIPFVISSALIPAMLISIKFLMAKSIFVGKIAVILMLISFFRRRANGGGVFNHYDPNIAEEHYGYKGIEEPGVYIHKRRKKRK